jgi:hypothetical protein
MNYSPHAESSSSGSGSKNDRVTLAFPFIAPNRREGASLWVGSSRTTGVFPLAISTSSPAQARAIKRERLVFAS